ncbi:MAG TPA: helix-turn-helix transcriptional regulator [Pseudonocardiaceae bacterium]
MSGQDPTVQRRRLGRELGGIRRAGGHRQADVAGAMDWSPSKLVRIENGQVTVSTNDLRALLAFYGEPEERLAELMTLARAARGASFFDHYDDVLKPGFKAYLAYESSAVVIRQYEPVLVPGLFQTEEYARRILSGAAGFGERDVERAWTVRQHRQELHDRESPPQMCFVIDEVAIRRQVGSAGVMAAQVRRLLEFAAMPHVSLRVLPLAADAHPGLLGSFALLEFRDEAIGDLLHLESALEITVRDDIGLIAGHLDKFAIVERLALSADDTRAVLATVADEWAAAR